MKLETLDEFVDNTITQYDIQIVDSSDIIQQSKQTLQLLSVEQPWNRGANQFASTIEEDEDEVCNEVVQINLSGILR